MTISLPRLLVLTDRTQCRSGDLVGTVRSLVDAGVRGVVLREKDLPAEVRRALAAELAPVLRASGGRLLVASDTGIPNDGVHLAADEPLPDVRPAVVGRSCHSIEAVEAAEGEGCDYVTLSPVFASRSKPGYGPALGEAELRRANRRARLPIYALGGVDRAEKVTACLAVTAGVAIMGLAMRDPDAVRAIVTASDRSAPARSAS